MGYLARLALIISMAALLAGCGESQSPIGAPGGMPQTSAIATHAERGKSWMLPEAKSEDLLYISTFNGVTVYSYPSDNGRWAYSVALALKPMDCAAIRRGMFS